MARSAAHPFWLSLLLLALALLLSVVVGSVFVPPATMLAVACRFAGREESYRRLAGSLVADPTALKQLGWTPVVTTSEGLAALMR